MLVVEEFTLGTGDEELAAIRVAPAVRLQTSTQTLYLRSDECIATMLELLNFAHLLLGKFHGQENQI